MTAISPTPAGEGKTVVSLGLGDALRRLGRSAAVCIREPSLGPTLGMKGGGAGGGRAQAHPAMDLNLHFTGDFHAITSAHNLLAALIDSHIHHGNAAGFGPHSIFWKRAIDLTDRSLREIITGLGGRANGTPRETGFLITAASEVMALLSLCSGWDDLRTRLGEIVVGATSGGEPIRVADLRAQGAMAVLLRDAALPNLVQTLEGTPVFVHTGPFGNLATGCNSVLADRAALGAADFVVTEAGFGADLGFEKFCHLVAPQLGRGPDAVVVVATVRGVKAHSGCFRLTPGRPLPEGLERENLDCLRAGAVNLKAHLDIVRRFGPAPVVAINRFPTDTDAELALLRDLALACGAVGAETVESFARGGEGGISLASRLLEVCTSDRPGFRPLYCCEDSLIQKIETIAREVYGAAGVQFQQGVRSQLKQLEKWGYGALPVCMAKTQYSLSHDPEARGAPAGFTLPVASVELAAGAGFVRVLCGDILTMPGLPAHPAALSMDLSDSGEITGIH